MDVIGSREIAAGVEPAHLERESRNTHRKSLAHDVSILAGAGRHLGSQPRANTSMTIITQLARQRVHDVKVRHRQQLRFAVGQPSACRRALTLRAMPVAAGVVGDQRMAAGHVLATRDMPAERCRATALDRAHHLQLVEAHMATVGLAPSRTVVAEDVRDLQSWSSHNRGRYCAGGSSVSRFERLWRRALRRTSGLSILAIMPVATRV